MVDRNTIKKQIDEAKIIERINTNDSLKIAKKALEIAIQNNYKREELRALIVIGRCYWIMGEFSEASATLTEALDKAKKQRQYYEIAEVEASLGNIFVTLGLHLDAIKHYNNALKYAASRGFTDLESRVFNNIGTIHEEFHDYDNAISYYERSKNAAKKVEDAYLSAIGSVNLGNVFLAKGEYNKSLVHLEEALIYAEESNKNILLAHIHLAYGQYYKEQKDCQKSVNHLLKGIKYAEISNDTYVLVRIHIELANVFHLNNENNQAIEYFNKAEEIAKRLGFKNYTVNIYEEMALFYQKINEPELAQKYLIEYYKATKEREKNRVGERLKTINFQEELKVTKKGYEETKNINKILKNINKRLKALSEIGHAITATSDLNYVFEIFNENIYKLMDSDNHAITIFNKDTNSLESVLHIEDKQPRENFSVPLNNKASFGVKAFRTNNIVIAGKEIKDIRMILNEIIDGKTSIKSALFVPITVEEEPIGVLTVQSRRNNAYNKDDIDVIKLLASYLAIAINNYNKTKELNKANEVLQKLSETDGLTGIANRRKFDKRYKELWDEAAKKDLPLSMLMIDIDKFKDFNDIYGHLVGDDILRFMGKKLREMALEDNCFAARYGGDEFVILLPFIEKEKVSEHKEKVRRVLKSINSEFSIKRNIHISIGSHHLYPSRETNELELIEKADKSLYEDKNRIE